MPTSIIESPAHPQHEQVAVAGEVGGQREDLLDVLLGQHVGAGGDVADQRDVADGSALDGAAPEFGS